MEASVQYNDYLGTAAADFSDFEELSNFLKSKGVDVERFNPIGVRLDTRYTESISYYIICTDNKHKDDLLVQIGFEGKCSFEEFFNLFKRLEIILVWNGANQTYREREIDPEPIMIDDSRNA